MTLRTVFVGFALTAFVALAAAVVSQSEAAMLVPMRGTPDASPVGSPMASPMASPAAESGLLATVQAKQSATAEIRTATAEALAAETVTAQAQLDQTATSEALAATAAAQAAVDNAIANATENAELQSALVVMATEQAVLEATVTVAVSQGTMVAATSEAADRASAATASAQSEAVNATSEAQMADADATIESQQTQIAELELTGTANARPTDTPTVTPEPTSTPKPTATATPTPSPTPLPRSGDVLYRTGKTGFKKWPLSAEWKYLNGMLVNDGSGNTSTSWIRAPYSPGALSNYAVEADIQLIRDDEGAFGIVVRASGEGDGYWVGVQRSDWTTPRLTASVNIGKAPELSGSDVAMTSFDPGSDWHTYRVEVEGNTIRMLVDGGLVVEAIDNRFLNGGDVGLFSYYRQINIRDFKIIAMDNGFDSEGDDSSTDEESSAYGAESTNSAQTPAIVPIEGTKEAEEWLRRWNA
jgi:hypothetical protein